MRRDRPRRLLRRGGVALAALLVALLLFAPQAEGRVRARDDARPGPADAGRPLDPFDRLLRTTARQTTAYEKACRRADLLRGEVSRLRTKTQDAEARARARARARELALAPALVPTVPRGTVPTVPRGTVPTVTRGTVPTVTRGMARGTVPTLERGTARGMARAMEAGAGATILPPTALSTVLSTALSTAPSTTPDLRTLRAALDQAVTELRAAERSRAGIRRKLWRALEPAGSGTAGPAAGCALGERSKKPRRVTSRWRTPTIDYWLSAGYAAAGAHWRHRHTGQDFAVPTGTPVYAVGPGTVSVVTCGDGFGNQVVIRHRDGYFTQYAHLSRINVRPGQKVAAGQRVGASGATGNVTGPHLHFEVRVTPYLGSAVPPLPWLRRHGVRM
ncbi:M23 family metallopeptidase [Streptomyces sp. NPDC002088]|uniref:M23 family metallopeptidase n=1 Tax=Streptomyces sp. NPDC002088 TaxID=3154665 RepID=UPI00331E3BBD